jgi:adhesin HecA-like repeat protein
MAVDLLLNEYGTNDNDDGGGGGGGEMVIRARVLEGHGGRVFNAYASRGVVLASEGLAGA